MNLRRFLARHGVPGMKPILEYQMAKVGSSSIAAALEEHKLAVFQLHRMNREHLERFPHAEPLTWFDDELRPVFGVDVYEHPFPASGHLRIGDVLVLKSELDDATKGAAVSEFLGIRNLVFRPANVTTSKAQGEAYKRFVSTLRLNPQFVEKMLESRYTRHFYTEVEREAMRRRYFL